MKILIPLNLEAILWIVFEIFDWWRIMLQNSGPFIPFQPCVGTKNLVTKMFMMSFLQTNKIWDQLTMVSNCHFLNLHCLIVSFLLFFPHVSHMWQVLIYFKFLRPYLSLSFHKMILLDWIWDIFWLPLSMML